MIAMPRHIPKNTEPKLSVKCYGVGKNARYWAKTDLNLLIVVNKSLNFLI
jgi:hypothetical protein